MESANSANDSKEVTGSLSTENFVYREDVVGCHKHENMLGVVLEVAGEVDSEGSITDESESEEDEDGGHGGHDEAEAGNNNGDGSDDEETNDLSDGQVRVVWTDGNETTENIGDVRVVDRTFLHGDIVALASDPTGQLGLVVDVSITVDLRAANGDVIKNVSSRDIKHIREFSVGDYVVYGSWLGRVDDVLDNVTVMFDDGSVCKVVKADPLRLKPLSRATIDNADFAYYPGQRVKATSSSVFKTSRWLTGLWKPNRLEGTVINVQPGSVTVYWIASALGLDANSSSVPAEEQNPKNLTLLSCFSYANWQLGDWCLLPSLPSSSISEDLSTSNQKNRSKRGKSKSGFNITERKNSNASQFVEVEHGSSESLLVQETKQGEIDNSVDNQMSEDHAVHVSRSHVEVEFSGNNQMSEGLNNCTSASNRTDSTETSQTETVIVLPESGPCSSSSSPKESANESWPYRKKLRKVIFKMDKKAHKRDEDFEKGLCIINTMTEVDVAWQDGRRECGVDSKCLIPVQTPNDQDFFPEQYVVEKVTNDDDESSEAKRMGIVRSVNSKDRTVCVRWFKHVSRPEDPREFDNDEIVSAYELDQHPDYDYCYGDVVVRLSPIPDTINNQTPTKGPAENADASAAVKGASKTDSNISEAEQKYEDESGSDFRSLSWVGNITGLYDGDIEVTWVDGMVSTVGPQAVFVVGRDDDGESFLGDSDDAGSWETVDDDQIDSLNNPEEETNLSNPIENTLGKENGTPVSDEESNLQNGPLSTPSTALGFLARLTGFFSREKKQPDYLDSIDAVLDGTESQETSKFPEHEASSHNSSIGEAETSDGHIEESGDAAVSGHNHASAKHSGLEKVVSDMPLELEMSDDLRKFHESRECKFKHFDCTENPLDHHFLSEEGQKSGGRKWVKKVQQEWAILEKNLPDDIFVRVFEDRMDLLRAVIIGAPGTPYQDGLFFFDFQLPSDYPHVPPSAYYHSGGLRVNPNLYVEGKVCLSLLNTWAGKGNEVWDPSSSSILQVLVSLQGLVLNSKPYFNEAGYEKQVGTIEGEKNSLIYNENAYLLNLKSMMYLLRRPPMHFEEFVKDHFRRRGPYILKACDAYMSGCLIGSLTKDACETEKSREQPSSVGFKLMLGKILPRLVSSLCGVGVDCQQFERLPQT